MKAQSTESQYPKGRAPIRPELLAAKLAALRNHEHPELLEAVTKRPRLVEMLWFIQWASIQPGGLLKFCEDMIEHVPGRLGTKTMLAAKPGPLSLEAKLRVYPEIPSRFRPHEGEEVESLIGLMLVEKSTGEQRTTKEDRALVCGALRPWTIELLRDTCLEAAREILPEYLAALCTEKDKPFEPRRIGSSYDYDGYEEHRETWFIDDAIGAVMQMMDAQAERAQRRLAMTEVAKLVFDRLDYALAEKVMVRIEGGTRFGKTEALSAWVNMRPGLARLVRVPRDNSMASLFKRVGEALGIDCSYGSGVSRLKERVEYIIQHGGLFLVFDEAHYLAPMNFTTSTPPHRLNWIRDEIVDRGLPLAISATPQAFKGAIDRFVKKTGYDMAQFFGRVFLTATLPEVLSEADLIAVARIHFPGLGENALGYIANEARLSQNYLQAVEAIAHRVRFLANKHGGAVRLKEIQTAVCEVLPRGHVRTGQEQAPAAASRDGDAGRTNPAREGLLNVPLIPVSRSLQASRNVGGEVDLDSSSLRGAGPVRASTELVSAET